MNEEHEQEVNRRRAQPRPPRLGRLEQLESIKPAFFLAPELEKEICRLGGVISARVLSTGVEIDEIHIIAPPDRVPKKLVRDIESLLLVKFGIRVDHRRISIVHVGSDQPATHAIRPLITSVKPQDGSEGAGVCVELAINGQVIEGLGEAGPGETEMHAAGRAVIHAVEKLLSNADVLRLQDVSLVKLGDQAIVVVLLNWMLDGEFLYLVGATMARGALAEAAARATFDALNRKLVRV